MSRYRLVPPHKVLAFSSGQAALHRIVPVPGPPIRTQGEAEASGAVANLKHAVGSEERFSFIPVVVDRLKVVVNCSVAQLFHSLQSPSSPQVDDTNP